MSALDRLVHAVMVVFAALGGASDPAIDGSSRRDRQTTRHPRKRGTAGTTGRTPRNP